MVEAWGSLRERWLTHDPEALGAVVEALWRPSQREGHRRPSFARDQLDWLRRRNIAPRLREVVLR